jgi:hypothetical protein
VKSFEIRCLKDLNGDGILLFNCVFSQFSWILVP